MLSFYGPSSPDRFPFLLRAVSPVYEDVVRGAVVLDLVHADAGDVVLGRPPDDRRARREVRHADPLLVGPEVTPADVGLDGSGDVGRPRVRVQLGVKMRRGVDDQLHRRRGLPGRIGGDACELPRILQEKTETGKYRLLIHIK